MDDLQDPVANRTENLLLGALIGICTAFGSVFCGVCVVALMFSFLQPEGFEPGQDGSGRMPMATFDALVPYVVGVVALVVAALLGRLVVGRWRGTLNGAGAPTFAVITVLGVSCSPVVATDWAVPLAAIAAAGLWGVAFLRPTRDVSAA